VVRIGNCSGFSGDRRSAIREILDGDPVDVIVGDYLAEVTMASMVQRTAAGHPRLWSDEFAIQLEGNLAEILDRGIKVVVNAGGFDPAGLAAQVRASAAALGRTASVAHVAGDNLLGRLEELTAARSDRRTAPAAGFINGVILPVDGGRAANGPDPEAT